MWINLILKQSYFPTHSSAHILDTYPLNYLSFFSWSINELINQQSVSRTAHLPLKILHIKVSEQAQVWSLKFWCSHCPRSNSAFVVLTRSEVTANRIKALLDRVWQIIITIFNEPLPPKRTSQLCAFSFAQKCFQNPESDDILWEFDVASFEALFNSMTTKVLPEAKAG